MAQAYMDTGLVHLSFNRYMVECECIISLLLNTLTKVLIDTWWNVNCDNQIRVL